MSVSEIVAERAERYLDWYIEACSIPSLADEPDSLADMVAWLDERFHALGASTERLSIEGAPDAILATLGSGGSGERSVLVYDHYDVQPVDPIELWESKPFSPEVRNGVLYARGAADNKGDLVARLAALEVYAGAHGDPPFQIKFLVEGEEETGSRSFPVLVARYGHKLAADGCIWEGAGLDLAGRPELVFGAKGLAYVELNHRGLASDQHSSVAVIAPSPVWYLVEALISLRSPDGRVLIEGFYDDVVPPSEADEKMLEVLPFEEEAEKRRLGVESFVGGATGLDLIRRYFFEPTCNIAGIDAGFTVPGASKTVLPRSALAKVDFRLVPDQDPADIVVKLRRHLAKHGFEKIEILGHSMEHPVRSPSDSVIGRAAISAAEKVYADKPAIAPLMIATGPMHPIAGTLGIPTVSPAGVCRPDSNIHAPNEHCLIEDFNRTIEYTVAWLEAFGSSG